MRSGRNFPEASVLVAGVGESNRARSIFLCPKQPLFTLRQRPTISGNVLVSRCRSRLRAMVMAAARLVQGDGCLTEGNKVGTPEREGVLSGHTSRVCRRRQLFGRGWRRRKRSVAAWLVTLARQVWRSLTRGA